MTSSSTFLSSHRRCTYRYVLDTVKATTKRPVFHQQLNRVTRINGAEGGGGLENRRHRHTLHSTITHCTDPTTLKVLGAIPLPPISQRIFSCVLFSLLPTFMVAEVRRRPLRVIDQVR